MRHPRDLAKGLFFEHQPTHLSFTGLAYRKAWWNFSASSGCDFHCLTFRIPKPARSKEKRERERERERRRPVTCLHLESPCGVPRTTRGHPMGSARPPDLTGDAEPLFHRCGLSRPHYTGLLAGACPAVLSALYAGPCPRSHICDQTRRACPLNISLARHR